MKFERVAGTHPGRMPERLVLNIKKGMKKTIAEWAEYEGTSYAHVSCTLGSLRKRGFNLYPYQGFMRVGGQNKKGIVDVTDKPEWLVSGINRYEDHYAIPSLTAIVRMVESGLEKYPELANELKGFLDNMSVKSVKNLPKKKKLKLISKK